jgi:hypothetical protein
MLWKRYINISNIKNVLSILFHIPKSMSSKCIKKRPKYVKTTMILWLFLDFCVWIPIFTDTTLTFGNTEQDLTQNRYPLIIYYLNLPWRISGFISLWNFSSYRKCWGITVPTFAIDVSDITVVYSRIGKEINYFTLDSMKIRIQGKI